MLSVDSHQHFWSLARGDYFWMDPASAALAPIRRDFAPADLDALRTKWRIDRTVLVQAAPSIEETEYMLGLADATPWIGKVVGWVNFEDPTHRRHLERFARHPKFAGVRPMIQDIADPDWMHRPDIGWAFDALIDLDLTFDALGHPVHAANFLKLFTRYPSLRSVVDHGMKPVIRDQAFEPWATEMTRIARETGAFCKLSGLVTEAGADWSFDSVARYARHIISVFGPDRVMWGSDWPVVTLAASYDAWRDAAERIVGPVPGRDMIFGGTAARFYRLD